MKVSDVKQQTVVDVAHKSDVCKQLGEDPNSRTRNNDGDDVKYQPHYCDREEETDEA